MFTVKAVSSFFKPVSQREPELITWKIIKQSLIVGKFAGTQAQDGTQLKRRKIAAFDLDDTLICANAGSKWNRSATSWKWWNTSIPSRLRDLYKDGYLVVIISNQGNISLKDNPKTLKNDPLSLSKFKDQLASVMRHLDIPISVYGATMPDHFRKPRVGMWHEILADHDLSSDDGVDMQKSFYVGDAAGRAKTSKRNKDHACSDRDFASNVGISFRTPEEYFSDESPEQFERAFEPQVYLNSVLEATSNEKADQYSKRKPQELIIFCGSPGAGKSTFYWKNLEPLAFQRVNQDILKTRDKCIKVAREHLRAGVSVVVDNTNADVETRAIWVKIAQEFKIPIHCIHFTAPTRLCEHNNVFRVLSGKHANPEQRTLLPGIAFRSFSQRYTEPSASEGFESVIKANFSFQGSPDQETLWRKYLVSNYST